MTAPTTKLQAAEHDLKQLMVDVTRAVRKAQQAVARITGKAMVTAAVTEPTPVVAIDARSNRAYERHLMSASSS